MELAPIVTFNYELGQWVTVVGKVNPEEPFAFWIAARQLSKGKKYYLPKNARKWIAEERLVASGTMITSHQDEARTVPKAAARHKHGVGHARWLVRPDNSRRTVVGEAQQNAERVVGV